MKLPNGAFFVIALVLVAGVPIAMNRFGPERADARTAADVTAGGAAALQPSSDVPTFAESVARENETVADTGPGSGERQAVRSALMTAVRAYRAAPCSQPAKAGYLRAVTAYRKARLQSVRGDVAREDLWRTVLDKYLSQAMDQQAQHGFVTEREQAIAELSSSPLAMLFVRFSPLSPDADLGAETACQVVQRGGVVPPLNLIHPDKLPKIRVRTNEEIYTDTHDSFLGQLRYEAGREDFCAAPARVSTEIGSYFYMKAWVEGARGHRGGEAGRAKARTDWDTPTDREVIAKVRALISSGRLTRSRFDDDFDQKPELKRLFDQTPLGSTEPCTPLPPVEPYRAGVRPSTAEPE